MASPNLLNIWSWYHRQASASTWFNARPLQEVAMIQASAWFRNQPGWLQFLHDSEHMRRTEQYFRHEFRLSVKQARFVIRELEQYYGPVEASNCEVVRQMPSLDGVWFSDVTIDADLRNRLHGVFDKLVAQKRLHASPRHRLEYNLVFPTRHALVRGVSKQQLSEFAKEEAIGRMGSADAVTIPVPPKQYEHGPESLRHAWLPCDVQVDATGQSARVVSYIPGVHPSEHADVYDVLGDALSAFLPLWQRVIVDSLQPDVHRLTIASVVEAKQLTDENFSGRIRKRLERQRAAANANCQPQQPEASEDDEQIGSDDEFYTPDETSPPVSLIEKKAYARSDVYNDSSTFFKLPDPANNAYRNMEQKAAVHTDDAAVEQLFSWKGRRLQVVVRMAEVELNADMENPIFPGGAWHVEGMEHECIVASGIYYLDHDNLTPCSIEFRHSFDDPPGIYDDEFACEQFWGARTFQEFGFVRKMGEVPIRAGRAVAFPNLWQHRVTAFKLQAGQTHGRRRVLVFFLVDPFRPVISSATVVPQERAWAHAAFFQQLRAAMPSCCDDLIGLIWSYIEDDFGWDAATATNFETKMQQERATEARALAQHVGRRVQTAC